MKASQLHQLYHLARLYGVQTAYYDVEHHRRQASTESLLAVLRSLGASVTTLDDVPSALRERQQSLWQQPLEPVATARGDEPLAMEVRLPASMADAPLVGHLVLETGEQRDWKWQGAGLEVIDTAEVEETRYVVKRLPLPGGLPLGYHRFTLELPGRPVEALIIGAPIKAYTPPEGAQGRTWGVFLPLYAFCTQRSWGSGDLSDLEDLLAWVREVGGGVVATLPLLATFLDEPFEPSPYAPVSRLLWNEFYLDVTRVPELRKCPSAQAIMSSSSFQQELESLRGLPLVDYRRQMALKRWVLEELSRCFFVEASDRLDALHSFAKAHPVVEDYARFRATCEKRRASWQSWPSPLREGVLRHGDYDEEAKQYHIYVQWQAHQQFQALFGKARQNGQRLYLDLPLGVHPDGYDVWRERSVFATDISGGAPPDVVFTKGQNWGFPPLHPEKIREQGYRYIIAYLRHHLQHAGLLRIDHVMGLHRLFWIPEQMEASQGLYVRYPAEELYAVLALESYRNQAIIVGEDLGTVPPQVRPAMANHGLHRMYVVQYELASNHLRALRAVPANAVASLNTHDMPPFAAFWQRTDIQDRIELGLLDKTGAQTERRTRRATEKALVSFLRQRGWANNSSVETQAILRSTLGLIGASPARVVLVNLEDLWLETQPQNTPGTRAERPNWRHKSRYAFEAFSRSPEVLETLQTLNRLRRH